VVTAETRADANAEAAEAPVRLDGLDDAARRGLRHDRRIGQFLAVVGLATLVACATLFYRNQRLQHTGSRTHATVVDTDTGVFESVTLSYRWRGIHHRSVVHVDDADKFCTPDDSQLFTACTSHPTAIVDRNDPGHATLPNELDFSPPVLVFFMTCVCFFLPVCPLFIGLFVAGQARRRRRKLASHPWRLRGFQVRGSRERARRRGGLFEITEGDGIWQSLRFVNTSQRRIESLLTEETVEIAGAADGGPVVVRAPGSSRLLTAELAPSGVTAVDSIIGAEIGECEAATDGPRDAGAALLLSGALCDFDILGPRGESVGEITRRRKRYQVFDREGRLRFTIMRKAGRSVASHERGTEIVALRGHGRRMSFEFPVGTDGIGRSWATSVAPVGASKTRWALRDVTGLEMAHVTRIHARYAVEILEGDGALDTPLVVQAILVALANPAPR
jgi:hypothetical protein